MAVRSNDGVLYREDEWEQAKKLVEDHLSGIGKQDIQVGPWVITGAIAGFADGDPVEFYMRDLVRGIIRSDSEAFREYFAQVLKSGMLGE